MKTKAASAKDEPRQPSREQKREIVQMLELAYDVGAGRYKGDDTDKTVADALGLMPGWVAEIREDMFGPDGGNAALDAVVVEFAELQKMMEKLGRQIECIKKAVGPRAGRG